MLATASVSNQNLPLAGCSTFLRMVAGDERFRAELQADPRSALSRFGLTIDSSLVPEEVKLPEKAILASALSDLGVGPGTGPDQEWSGFIGH